MEILLNKGRGRSLNDKLNFLARQDNIFIMDNHLAAFWCWCKLINPIDGLSLLHIDRHHDIGDALVKEAFHKYKKRDFRSLTIDKVLKLTVTPNKFPLLQWDNYIRLYNAFFPYTITDVVFVTKQKLPRDYQHYKKISLQKWMQNAERTLPHNYPKIINIDIDIFYIKTRSCYKRVVSKKQIQEFVNLIQPMIDKAVVVTIALSPECCGGWKKSLKVCNEITSLLNINFDPTVIKAL